jgi:hypothetical protein
MFTADEREVLRTALVREIESDARIVAAAHTGSASVGRLDRWSDIDLALSVSRAASMDEVIGDWTATMHRKHDAVAHVDVRRGNTLFRVFLLRSSLQVDLAFWPESEFGATAPTFRLIFGTANQRPPLPPARAAAELIGMAWLYALHVRSSLARARLWQAEYMLSAMRDQVLALACLRHGLDPRDARGVDDLPNEIHSTLFLSLVCRLDAAELKQAFSVLIDALLDEARRADSASAELLSPTLVLLND